MSHGKDHVVVVGAGIAGLAAAYFLSRDGAQVTVLESSGRFGGKVYADEIAGVPVDLGAESMLARRPEAVELAKAVGLGDELTSPATTGATLWSRGRLRAMPAGHVMGVPGDLDALAASGVISPDGLARIPLDLTLPPAEIGPDIAVGDYVAGRLGREVVDRLVEPLLGGVYAGRPDDLSLAATMPALAAELPASTSVLGAAIAARDAGARSRGDVDGPVFVTVRDGIGSLPAALAAGARADVRLDAAVTALRRVAGGFELDVEGGPTLTADAVVLATPAAPTARLLTDLAPDAVEPLRAIPYASMAVVAMAFPEQPVSAGSGLLVPPVTGRLVKGVTVSSSKWPHLGGALRVRSSVGRFGDDAALGRDDADLTDAVVADVAGLLDLERPEPLQTHLVRWVDGLPQYLVGHPQRVAAIRAAVGAVPGLAVAGAAYGGVGVPACIRDARRAVAGLG
jgi:protoporphyrinogen/coproporphyrinogen III oxidase